MCSSENQILSWLKALLLLLPEDYNYQFVQCLFQAIFERLCIVSQLSVLLCLQSASALTEIFIPQNLPTSPKKKEIKKQGSLQLQDDLECSSNDNLYCSSFVDSKVSHPLALSCQCLAEISQKIQEQKAKQNKEKTKKPSNILNLYIGSIN